MSPVMPAAAWAAATAVLPGMTVHRLRSLLRSGGDPRRAWEMATGQLAPTGAAAEFLRDESLAGQWRASGGEPVVEQVWQRCCELGQTVLVDGSPDYPAALRDLIDPPPVLFARGDLSLFEGRRVGIVGTRNATSAGRATATALGRDLAAAGAHVVSGLARGIDGCAHQGVLTTDGPGRAIAVVGSGLDVVYPPEHHRLWARVAERGLLLSEAPPGRPPEPWRFPQRNRIIAALAEVLVVVESRETGGSLITVDEALECGRPVMAVPGPVGSRSSSGTNRLLRDGAAVVLDASDVLTALAIDHLPLACGAHELRARPSSADRVVYDACAGAPSTLDGLALATGWPLAEVAMALARLRQHGWVVEVDGWFEIDGAPL
jgi:DNA processing protein